MILNRSAVTIAESPILFEYFSKVLEEPIYVHQLKQVDNLKYIFVLDVSYKNLAEASIRELASGRVSVSIETLEYLTNTDFKRELMNEIKQFRSKALQNI